MRNVEGMHMQNLPVSSEVKVFISKEELSETEKIKKGICPACEGTLTFQEGCKVCYACGWGGCE